MQKKIIEASRESPLPDFQELVRYKDLFFTLAWRDFRVRYSQTTVGFLWAFIQPVITLVILSLVFGSFDVNTNGAPPMVFISSGLILWTYFSFVLTNSGSSLISSQAMIKKIYFPRLIIPLSKALVGFIDFGIAFLLLLFLCIYYNYLPSGNLLMAPVFIILTIFSALGSGILISALSVRFRDFQHILPFIVQIGLYITPVAYPVSVIAQRLPKWAEVLFYLNPMAGITEGFRWSLFGGETPDNLCFVSFGMTFLIFFTGIYYFRKIEDQIADYI